MNTILVNGQPCQIPVDSTVQAMLDLTGNAQRKVAVEINLEIVPKSQHARRVLIAGDRVEIVQAMGGG